MFDLRLIYIEALKIGLRKLFVLCFVYCEAVFDFYLLIHIRVITFLFFAPRLEILCVRVKNLNASGVFLGYDDASRVFLGYDIAYPASRVRPT